MSVIQTAPKSDDAAIQEIFQNIYTVTNAGAGAGSVILTVPQFVNGVYVQADGGAAANKTTPSAAAIVAGIVGCAVGSTFDFILRNEDAGDAMTIVAGTGVTLKGTAAIAATKNGVCKGVVTNATAGAEAVTLYILAQG